MKYMRTVLEHSEYLKILAVIIPYSSYNKKNVTINNLEVIYLHSHASLHLEFLGQ